MKLIKSVLFAAIAMMALVLGVLFSTRNSQAVPLDLILFQLPPTSMAIWLLLSLALGGLICASMYSVINFRLKRDNKQLKRRISKLNEVEKTSRVSH